MKNKDFLIDYSGYILLKSLGPLIRLLPLPVSFFIGRMIGDFFYLADLKHRSIAYVNIKTALGDSLTPCQIRGVVRKFYRSFGQNIIEIFCLPRFDKKYLNRYVEIEGQQNIQAGFKKGKGVIFVAMHAGNWELSNIIAANLGIAFCMFVREQNFPRLEKLLNFYRSQQGCRFIQRENELRELIRVLKANESVAMTIDQGGRSGTLVKFFGKYASMASGAVRLALKLDCALLPVFPARVKGPFIKFQVAEVFEPRSTGNLEEDVRINLQSLVRVFEKYIAASPQEYLWTYKIWKYSRERDILILSDGKTGHLRQSQALAGITADYLKAKGITANIKTIEVGFKGGWASRGLTLANCLAGKYICQGCMLCLRAFARGESYQRLIGEKPDIVISCGSALVAVNYLLSRENRAKSFVIMRPSVFSTRRFDLVVMAKHDRPLKRRNVAIIDGALNLIDQEYLADQTRRLSRETGISFPDGQVYFGLMIGGDTKDFRMEETSVRSVLESLKGAALKYNAQILSTTSRRSPKEVDSLIKQELSGFARSKLNIIASENNFSSAVGGILGLSRIVVVSGESISMVSEAASSLKHVVVFKSKGLPARKNIFLENIASQGMVELVAPNEVGKAVERIMNGPSPVKPLRDKQIIIEFLRRII